jgi:hypothetical protein
MFMYGVKNTREKAQVRVLWLQRLLVSNVSLCRGWDRQEWRVQLGPNESPENNTPN